MKNKLAIFLGVVILMTLATNVWSQTEGVVDTPYQVRYASLLDAAESWVNITNSGARGSGLDSGNGASTTGAICANVYVFSSDEQLIACCSCPVTPNGLVNLGARRDLISNPLTPEVPDSIVIKLVGTEPIGGSCNGSAANASANITQGLLAWGTTTHEGAVIKQTSKPNTLPKCAKNACTGTSTDTAWCKQNCPPIVTTTRSLSVTETPFVPSTLSAGERAKQLALCSFILSNGSGFGICKSCRLGGQ